MPFAAALGINDALTLVRAKSPSVLERDLDRPTPFTKRGIFVQRASKGKLFGVVGFKDVQAGYLKLQVEGGERTPKGRALIVPVGQRLNKYGNIPRGAVARSVANSNVFAGKIKGRAGIYRRNRSGRVKLLVAFEDREFS